MKHGVTSDVSVKNKPSDDVRTSELLRFKFKGWQHNSGKKRKNGKIISEKN